MVANGYADDGDGTDGGADDGDADDGDDDGNLGTDGVADDGDGELGTDGDADDGDGDGRRAELETFLFAPMTLNFMFRFTTTSTASFFIFNADESNIDNISILLVFFNFYLKYINFPFIIQKFFKCKIKI